MASISPACSEHELIAAARRGEDRAFEELYARYRDRIGAFILGRVRDHGRAEDIVQEVFISALRRLRASDQAIIFKPWIYEIAKNACIDEFRRAQRTNEVSLDDDDELAGGRRGLLSVAPTPPAAVESKQQLNDLCGAFGGLSENHHQLLVMREFEGLSYDQIGARTGMSRQIVESSLFRARRKLTEEYDDLASGRRCQQVQTAIEDGRVQSLRSFGIRERRQLTRHLAHCQSCRVKAHLAGVDEALVKPRSVAAKIAALLPFPLWRWPWRGGGGARKAATRTGSHHLALQGAAAAAQPAAATTTLGGAIAAAAAAIAIVGAGGGIISELSSHARVAHAGAVVAPHHPGSAGSATAISAGAGAARNAARSRAAVESRSPGGARVGRAVPYRSHPPASSSRGVGSSGTVGAPAGSAAGSAAPAHPLSGVPSVGTLPVGGRVATTGAKVTGIVKKTVGNATHVVGKTISTVTGTAEKSLTAVSGMAAKTLSGATGSAAKTVSGATGSAAKTLSGATGSAAKTVSSTKKLAANVSSTASSLLP